MYKRWRTALAMLLMAAAVVLVIVPMIRHFDRTCRSFAGSGKTFQMPVTEDPHGTISVNTGDVDELCQLHGIGETLAAMIISERETNGPFYYAEDLISVRGIGLKKLSQFRDDIDY